MNSISKLGTCNVHHRSMLVEGSLGYISAGVYHISVAHCISTLGAKKGLLGTSSRA